MKRICLKLILAFLPLTADASFVTYFDKNTVIDLFVRELPHLTFNEETAVNTGWQGPVQPYFEGLVEGTPNRSPYELHLECEGRPDRFRCSLGFFQSNEGEEFPPRANLIVFDISVDQKTVLDRRVGLIIAN